MVVLAVSPVDRASGVYYGAGLDGTFAGGTWGRVVDAMNERFANGDWTGGILAGLGEVNRLNAPDQEPGQDDTDTSTASTGSDGSWGWGLGVAGGLAAAGGLGYGGIRLRRRAVTRAAARAEASAASDEAAAAFLRLEEVSEFTGARAAALPLVTDSGITAGREQSEQARAAGEAATATYLTHGESYTPERIAKADPEEARVAAESGNAAAALLTAAVVAWE